MERIAWESAGGGRNIWATYCTCHCELTSHTLSDAVHVRDTAVLHTHSSCRQDPPQAAEKRRKREKKWRRTVGWEMGDGRKARQGMMDLFGWGVVRHSRAMQQILGETPLAHPAVVHQQCSAWARFGLNGDKRGKSQWKTGRREGKVQRERDSQSTEFLQALLDPDNQQSSSWQQGI